MAARRSGLTPEGLLLLLLLLWCDELWGCGSGVLVRVGRGVVTVEGSSEVNIVVEEGEMRYRALRVPSRASRKPVEQKKKGQ